MTNKKDKQFHADCFACGSDNIQGLNMKFENGLDGSTCHVSIPKKFQSYEGTVHGGIVATILDAAMVHALRQNSGGNPFTCRLEVRYLRPVPLGKILTVNARATGKRGRVMLADAEIMYLNQCYARGHGAFTLQINLKRQ